MFQDLSHRDICEWATSTLQGSAQYIDTFWRVTHEFLAVGRAERDNATDRTHQRGLLRTYCALLRYSS